MLFAISITAVANCSRIASCRRDGSTRSSVAQKRSSASCTAASRSGTATITSVLSASSGGLVASERLLDRSIGPQYSIEGGKAQHDPPLLSHTRQPQVAARYARRLQAADERP